MTLYFELKNLKEMFSREECKNKINDGIQENSQENGSERKQEIFK